MVPAIYQYQFYFVWFVQLKAIFCKYTYQNKPEQTSTYQNKQQA